MQRRLGARADEPVVVVARLVLGRRRWRGRRAALAVGGDLLALWRDGVVGEEGRERLGDVDGPQVGVRVERRLEVAALGGDREAVAADRVHVEAHRLVLGHLLEEVALGAVEALDELADVEEALRRFEKKGGEGGWEGGRG